MASREEAVDDPGSLYSEFDGTSGASALVAGVCALMQRQSTAERLDGPTVKSRLTAATNLNVSDWHWLSEAGTLQIDTVNGAPAPTSTDLFGQGGLVNAATLLNINWNDIND